MLTFAGWFIWQPEVQPLTRAAEDYYGNDYPEDEVDSDDEFGRDVYKYRNDASDAEDFEEDSDALSEDEYRQDGR